jgi:methionyl-tRNA formyltransferase
VRTVKGLAEGTLKETPQVAIGNRQVATNVSDGGIQTHLKHAPKIFTETCKIDFSKTVDEVHNLIRGLSPFPGAFTLLNGKTLKIYRSEKEASPELLSQPSSPPGESVASEGGALGRFETDNKTFLKFTCANGYVHVRELQLEGKKKMNVEEFLRGYRF